ncbi:MAG: hypothetical protein QM704_15370 [Anaeromyxobacteraceae bacterium]
MTDRQEREPEASKEVLGKIDPTCTAEAEGSWPRWIDELGAG